MDRSTGDLQVLVATLGLSAEALQSLRRPGESYADACDRLTVAVCTALRRIGLRRVLCPIEDDRNGETLSVRVAFFPTVSAGTRASFQKALPRWELLELEDARHTYDSTAAEDLRLRLLRTGGSTRVL